MAYRPERKFLRGEEVGVTLETTRYKISGKVFILQDRRLSDILNQPDVLFLTLTQARVSSLGSKEVLYEKDFLAINKDSIILVWEEEKAPPATPSTEKNEV